MDETLEVSEQFVMNYGRYNLQNKFDSGK